MSELQHVIDREGLVWRLVRDGGMAVRGTYVGVESIGVETLRTTRGPLIDLEAALAEAASPAALDCGRCGISMKPDEERKCPRSNFSLWCSPGAASPTALDVATLTPAVHAWFCGEGVKHAATVTPPACERGAIAILARLSPSEGSGCTRFRHDEHCADRHWEPAGGAEGASDAVQSREGQS